MISLGDGPLCGAQLRYLIRSAQGVFGGLSISAPVWRLGAEAAQDACAPKVLVRAKHDRALEDENARLFKTLAVQPLAGYVHVQLPRQKDRPAREAKLALRFATFNVCPPQGKADLPVLPIQAVEATAPGQSA
jgi:hypothetical protein